MPAITTDREAHLSPGAAISRRTFLATGAAVGGGLLLGQMAEASGGGGADGPPLREYDIDTNGITLHVTAQGEGPAVLFCHGFPDTSYTWRRQMKAVASAGYRAIAPDMRGYGRSSAPADATSYTPLHTAGDLVGLLDALSVPSAVLVGHDWGAAHAWNAALMRPDRFKAVFCMSVPIGHRVLPQRILGGTRWILYEAFIDRLPCRCRHGQNPITSLITSLNSNAPVFTAG